MDEARWGQSQQKKRSANHSELQYIFEKHWWHNAIRDGENERSLNDAAYQRLIFPSECSGFCALKEPHLKHWVNLADACKIIAEVSSLYWWCKFILYSRLQGSCLIDMVCLGAAYEEEGREGGKARGSGGVGLEIRQKTGESIVVRWKLFKRVFETSVYAVVNRW